MQEHCGALPEGLRRLLAMFPNGRANADHFLPREEVRTLFGALGVFSQGRPETRFPVSRKDLGFSPASRTPLRHALSKVKPTVAISPEDGAPPSAVDFARRFAVCPRDLLLILSAGRLEDVHRPVAKGMKITASESEDVRDLRPRAGQGCAAKGVSRETHRLMLFSNGAVVICDCCV